MASDSHPSATSRSTGRLRLAAALGGAGMLAAGLGAGVLQAQGQDVAAAAPGDAALGSQQPVTTTASIGAPADETANPNDVVSTTPLDPPPATAPDPQTQTQPAPAPPAEPPAAAPAAAPATEQAAPAPNADQPPATTTEPPASTTATTPAAPPATASEPAVKGAGTRQKTTGAAPRTERSAEDDERAAPATRAPAEQPLRNAEGVPTIGNPTTSIAIPGAAPIGVPNFFIDKFRIPPFLLPIYQAAGTEYGIRWEVLAAINEIETDYGRNLNVSSAGALGWMQFMPATWKQYGVDANGDGRKDPYNPVDAIFAAARYLKAAGGDEDLRRAVFAYNHADWYVDSVLMRARLVGGLPTDLVGSLTGLTQGRFPVAARARYADDLDERQATRRVEPGHNAAVAVESSSTRRGILIFAKSGSAAVATHDGTIVGRGRTARLGRYVQIRDAYGNTYTYARLASLAASQPVPRRGAKPTAALEPVPAGDAVEPKAGVADVKARLFAHPARPQARAAGGVEQLDPDAGPAGRASYVEDLLNLEPDQVTWKRLRKGSHVVAGTILGRIGRTSSTRAPHVLFEIRPAGRGAPRIDPKPILDGWKLLESTAIYRAKNRNPFHGRDAKAPTIGQILLMSKSALQQRVLANPRIAIYPGGRMDIRSGRIDRRVLALLEYLAANGLKPTVSCLETGHSLYTASGNISQHSSGNAVDVAAVNGVPIVGHQGAGSIADVTIRRILMLQGAMRPDQIISLMRYPSASNTLAMSDHADHIHVGFRPIAANTKNGSVVNATLKPGQWFKVIDRLGEIRNPVVRTTPSKAAITVRSVTPTARARARAARSAGSSR